MNLLRRVSRVAGPTMVLVSAACATPRQEEGGPFRVAGSGGDAVLLTVRNDDYRDATIYADWNGPKQRVGFVVGKTSETFRMEWKDFTVRFVVDFVGGGGMQSESIDVWKGDHLDFVIMPGW